MMDIIFGLACYALGLATAVIIACLVWRFQIVPDEDFSRE